MSIKKALQVIQPHSLALENKRRGLEGRRGGGKAQSQLDLHFINVSVKTWQTCDCHSVQFFNTFINRQMIHIWENMNGVALPRNYNSPSGFLLYISLFFFFFFKILIFGSMWQLTGRWQCPSSNCLTVTTRFNDQLFDLELATALNGQHFLLTLFFMTSFNFTNNVQKKKMKR